MGLKLHAGSDSYTVDFLWTKITGLRVINMKQLIIFT